MYSEIAKSHPIGSLQVDPQPSSLGGEEEAKIWRVGIVELRDGLLPLVIADSAVQTLEGVAAQSEELLHDVQHDHHLAEDQHTVSGLSESGQQLVQ